MNPQMEQQIKENKLKAAAEKVSITIQIPREKYRLLAELARLFSLESLTFINGDFDFKIIPCEKCPVGCNKIPMSIKALTVKDLCRGNFLTWLFSEDKNE